MNLKKKMSAKTGQTVVIKLFLVFQQGKKLVKKEFVSI